jgi:hypothetical protein
MSYDLQVYLRSPKLFGKTASTDSEYLPVYPMTVLSEAICQQHPWDTTWHDLSHTFRGRKPSALWQQAMYYGYGESRGHEGEGKSRWSAGAHLHFHAWGEMTVPEEGAAMTEPYAMEIHLTVRRGEMEGLTERNIRRRIAARLEPLMDRFDGLVYDPMAQPGAYETPTDLQTWLTHEAAQVA